MDVPFDIFAWIDSFPEKTQYEKLLGIPNWIEKMLEITKAKDVCSKTIFVEIPRPKSKKMKELRELDLEKYLYMAKHAALISEDYIPNQLVLTIENGEIFPNPGLEINPFLAEDIRNCPEPIILIYVGIVRVKGLKILSSHGNALIIDKNTLTYELFDPYGRTTPEIDIWFEKDLPYLAGLEGWKYLPPLELCPNYGPQYIAEKKEDIARNQKGYCMTWTLMYIHSRLSNPSIDPKIIVKLLTSPSGKDLRRYALLYNTILHDHYDWPFRD